MIPARARLITHRTRHSGLHPMKRKFHTFVGRPVAATRQAMTVTHPTTLDLTPKEKQLRDLLVDVAASIDAAGRSAEPIVLRWAGGWVRDKLLGIESHDIDTAINAMTGYAFSLELRRYCIDPKNARKHNIAPGDLGSLHRIAANPEKSKHLETATTRVFNLEIDFVNLRKETYTHDSRNPIMEFGSAADDAYRRDATINALFYNLHSGEVEDLTGGLADMEAHLIRTPLTPLQTFTDDPLRVLRLIRFASRLQFTIDPAATAVMSERRVLDALSLKISRERVGIEIEKMLKGKHPLSSLRLIDNLNLYDSIFTDPGSTNRPVPNVSKWNRAYECLGRLADHRTEGSIYHTLALSGDGKSGDAVYFAWVLASVMPYAQAEAELSTSKGKTLPTTTVVAREGIKAPNRLCDVITAAYRHRADIAAWKQSMCTRQSRVAERDAIGMAIRRWDAQGGYWRLQVLYALLSEAMEGPKRDEIKLLHGWKDFLDYLADLDVMDAPSMKRLVDGRLLTKELGVHPGQWMGRALDICLAWQFRNPDEVDPAGAIAEVRRRSVELGIVGL